jgi:hypothetical protein
MRYIRKFTADTESEKFHSLDTGTDESHPRIFSQPRIHSFNEFSVKRHSYLHGKEQ